MVAKQQLTAQQAFSLAVNYFNAGQYTEAKHLCEALVAQVPDHSDAYNILGIIAQQLHHPDKAIDYLHKAIAINAEKPFYFNNLGGIYKENKQLQQALACFQKARELDCHYLDAYKNLIKVHEEICDWRDRSQEIKFMLDDLQDAAAHHRQPLLTPFASMSFPCDRAQQLTVAKACANNIVAKVAPLKATLNFIFKPRCHDRLRIGYISRDFRDHPTGHLCQGLFKYHDKSQFEIFTYFYGINDNSEYYQQIKHNSEHFITLTDLSYADAALRIYQDEIDILVEVNGHIQGNRLEIAALKPAPVQVSYIGYPGTLGADFMDYIISDVIVTPDDYAPFIAEKLALLPNSHRITNNEEEIATQEPLRAQFSLPEGAFVFCSFNMPYKIEPRIFAVWMNILKATPNSVLWLLRNNELEEANLTREAQAAGIDPKRLIFANRITKPYHLARCQLADLFLDTYYVNGHTTATDMLWAGLPVLTCQGETFASRIGASVLTAANLPELICDDLAQYQAKAIAFAQHPQSLAELRARLQRERHTCPLFDTQGLMRNLEKAYQKMWQLWENNQPPQQIRIEE